MNKQQINFNLLEKSFEKIIENTLIQTKAKFSRKTIKFLTQIGLNIIESISVKIGNLCENDSKKIISEEDILLILNELGLSKYILETNEEKNRIQSECEKLDNIIM
jgi:histone H3/H4